MTKEVSIHNSCHTCTGLTNQEAGFEVSKSLNLLTYCFNIFQQLINCYICRHKYNTSVVEASYTPPPHDTCVHNLYLMHTSRHI